MGKARTTRRATKRTPWRCSLRPCLTDHSGGAAWPALGASWKYSASIALHSLLAWDSVRFRIWMPDLTLSGESRIYRGKKISVFGSARSPVEHPKALHTLTIVCPGKCHDQYRQAEAFSAKTVRARLYTEDDYVLIVLLR